MIFAAFSSLLERALAVRTCENPAEWMHRCGFDGDREQQLLKMLAYKNLHE